jgi:DNA polymerase-3 subunit epsilon
MHFYFNPKRKVDKGAFQIHGISNNFLKDMPQFKDKVKEIIEYIKGANLIIHNARFDTGFLNFEISLCDQYKNRRIQDICSITDTLYMARRMFPGHKNSLDALCNRYGIDNQSRTLHGAIIDCKILSQVYLRMSGGQEQLVTNRIPELNKRINDIRHVKDILGAIPIMNIREKEERKNMVYLNIVQ